MAEARLMNRIDSTFARLREQKRGALIAFVCGGHPSKGVTRSVLPALSEAGACIIEVGVPFSDPIADGPVIAAAMHEVLVRPDPATPAAVMEEVAAARRQTGAGVVAMVSISIVHRCGPARFVADCARSGFDGLIVPDLPLEESGEVRALARDAGLTCTLLVAPTTPPDRAAAIARACTGFVYMLARTGITGERPDAPAPDLGERIVALRTATDLPIACGFGISTRQHVRSVVAHADAAIVGSALVRRMGEAAAAGRDPVTDAAALVRTLAAAL
jgi:tryptophan synthase alpha chain